MTTQAPKPTNHSRRRPAWLYWAVAMLFGPFIGAMGFHGAIGQATDLLASAFGYPDLSLRQAGFLRTLTFFGMPTVAMFCALRFTRLGRWLAINVLLMVPVLIADLLMAVYLAAVINRYVFDGGPEFQLWLSCRTSVIFDWLVGLAIGILFPSTLWHRYLTNSTAWAERARTLVAEL